MTDAEQQSKHYVQAAKYLETKTMYDAVAAQTAYEKAMVEKKTAELQHRRMQNATRPSIYLGARIDSDGDGYCATFGGLTAHGDTPEQTFENFDHLWIHGEAHSDDSLI